MSASQQAARDTIAQGMIVLALCIGGYMAFVDGPRQKIASAKAEAAAIGGQLKEAEALRDQVPALTAARERARADARAIADAGRLAREERDLFAAIMSLADSNHVTVEQMSPARVSAKASVTQASPQDQPAVKDVAVAYTITATGTYQSVAGFLRALRTGLGLSMVRSVRLAPLPAEAEPLVRATIETEHDSFDASPPPAADSARVAGAGGS